MAELEGQVSALESSVSALTSDLSTSHEELGVARMDAKGYADSAAETQRLYQSELVQHGRSMEELLNLKEKVSRVISRVYICDKPSGT